MTEMVEMERWARIGDFSPGSPPQVIAYCKSKHYNVPLHRKTRRPTVNDEALSRIIQDTQDPILLGVLRSRHLKKAVGYLYDTYLGRDNRLHPLFTNIPKTGRLSSKAPNLMNLPQGRKGDVMAEAAQAIRESFVVPAEGMVLAEFDWKNIEALLVGYFAEDPDYMRLARLGSHAYFTAHGVGKPPDMTWDDAKLLAYFNDIKAAYPKEYADFKKANLSNNYGQGLYNMAKDLGVTNKRAKEIRDIMAAAAPKVAAWKDRIQRQAHAQGYLTNPFGYIMTFFEVFKPIGTDEKGETIWKAGKEANEVLAFPAQSSGAAMLRECLITLGEDPEEGVTFELMIPTHDSILVAIWEEHFERIMRKIYDLMTRPWPELGGLSVEVEMKVGKDIRSMKGWHF